MYFLESVAEAEQTERHRQAQAVRRSQQLALARRRSRRAERAALRARLLLARSL